jgi:hypothetical protein
MTTNAPRWKPYASDNIEILPLHQTEHHPPQHLLKMNIH